MYDANFDPRKVLAQLVGGDRLDQRLIFEKFGTISRPVFLKMS